MCAALRAAGAPRLRDVTHAHLEQARATWQSSETAAIYAEDLYRDWNDGGRSQGGASARIDAEFARIRRELGDLPGVVSSPTRLRRMLAHLTKTLYPGILNDCFYQSATAVCRKQAKALGRPLPLHNVCLHCPNARRTGVHLPRLTWPATRPPRRWTSPPQAAATCRRCSASPCRPTSPTWTE